MEQQLRAKVFELSEDQMTSQGVTLGHVALNLSPEAALRFAATVPTDDFRQVALRLWQIGEGSRGICSSDSDLMINHPCPASA